jgi:hypothetical protein
VIAGIAGRNYVPAARPAGTEFSPSEGGKKSEGTGKNFPAGCSRREMGKFPYLHRKAAGILTREEHGNTFAGLIHETRIRVANDPEFRVFRTRITGEIRVAGSIHS